MNVRRTSQFGRWELSHLWQTAKLMTFSALCRRKAGAHFRTDFPHARWAGKERKQIVHTKGTKIKKTKGIWNNESLQLKNYWITFSWGYWDRGSYIAVYFGEQSCEAEIVARIRGIFAGAAIIKEGFSLLDENVRTILRKSDGACCIRWSDCRDYTIPQLRSLRRAGCIKSYSKRLSGICDNDKRGCSVSGWWTD